MVARKPSERSASRFRRKRRTKTITLPVDATGSEDLLATRSAVLAAKEALERAETTGDLNALGSARVALEGVSAIYEAALAGHPSLRLTFEAMSGSPLQKIQSEHAPTAEQVESSRRTDPDVILPWNPDTYPPALMVAACVGVVFPDGTRQEGMSVADATELWESSSFGDQQFMLTIMTLLNSVPSPHEPLEGVAAPTVTPVGAES